ncbi:MAG TPA: polyprenyl synthetase family protein [Candidatus Dojkabacteria bacterium]|nr:polyprenyl synthetase family protein [Candidatus Dojkabacteria bacterium]
MESLAQYAKSELRNIQEDLDIKLKEYLDTNLVPFATNFHKSTDISLNAYNDIVQRGGKRLRGAFVIKGYELIGGEKSEEIYKAAMAIEMIHAYLLVLDDFNDKSDSRRGGPTAHKIIEKFHIDNHLKGDPFHFGISSASIASLVGQHMANNLLLSINLPMERVVKAVRQVNNAINITALGQIRDIYNQTINDVTEEDVMKVHEYKTAVYTYLNPLQLGVTLAGATDEEIEKLKGYAIPAGIAFQLQDDILGMYGDPKDTGKSNLDDLKEGKMTLLISQALKNGSENQREEILSILGNRDLTPEQHAKVQQIIIDTGSLQYSKDLAHKLVNQAKEAMMNNFADRKDNEGMKFIVGIADYMIERDL